MKKLLLTSLLALPLMTTGALAEDHGKHKNGEKMFEATDTNGDGSLSLQEFKDHQAKKATEWFGKLDVNNDGKVTQEEAKEGRKKMHEKMKERRDGRKDGAKKKAE